MDYYITFKPKEIEDSDTFFSERLIKMSRIPFNYSMPKATNSNFKEASQNFHKAVEYCFSIVASRGNDTDQ